MHQDRDSFKVTLLFPLRDNDGNPFDQEVWRWWWDQITRLFAGFTDLGVVEGWWHGHSDLNRWIVVVVRTEREINQIREFLRLACKRFRQEAMYLEYHPVRFEEVR
jgi:hypothetical protein